MCRRCLDADATDGQLRRRRLGECEGGWGGHGEIIETESMAVKSLLLKGGGPVAWVFSLHTI